ncbi:hypothetical protein B0H19DRAFT_1062472 [Mycena capillaripes]|nr:hypothetical protein B0H19DRAFT_1062472 [Mycena capillaripes]
MDGGSTAGINITFVPSALCVEKDERSRLQDLRVPTRPTKTSPSTSSGWCQNAALTFFIDHRRIPTRMHLDVLTWGRKGRLPVHKDAYRIIQGVRLVREVGSSTGCGSTGLGAAPSTVALDTIFPVFDAGTYDDATMVKGRGEPTRRVSRQGRRRERQGPGHLREQIKTRLVDQRSLAHPPRQGNARDANPWVRNYTTAAKWGLAKGRGHTPPEEVTTFSLGRRRSNARRGGKGSELKRIPSTANLPKHALGPSRSRQLSSRWTTVQSSA